MPAYGAAKTKAPELSIAHAHAATATDIRHVKPPLHDVTNQDVASQCKREACAGHTTARGTAQKAARSEPTLVPDAELSTPPGASRAEVEGSVAHRANSCGCVQTKR